MRFALLILLGVLTLPGTAYPQSLAAPNFLATVLAAHPRLLSLSSIELQGTATWIAGSVRETGPVDLQSSVDGSSSIVLALDTASRIETRTAFGAARTCNWTDAKNLNHKIMGPDCEMPLAWFFPLTLAQPQNTLESLINLADDGVVSRTDGDVHEISYRRPLRGPDQASSDFLSACATMKLLFDPANLYPTSLEYTEHSSKNLNTSIPVRIVYSDYHTISGVPIPYRIDRYFNNTLQLSISISTATAN